MCRGLYHGGMGSGGERGARHRQDPAGRPLVRAAAVGDLKSGSGNVDRNAPGAQVKQDKFLLQ